MPLERMGAVVTFKGGVSFPLPSCQGNNCVHTQLSGGAHSWGSHTLSFRGRGTFFLMIWHTRCENLGRISMAYHRKFGACWLHLYPAIQLCTAPPGGLNMTPTPRTRRLAERSALSTAEKKKNNTQTSAVPCSTKLGAGVIFTAGKHPPCIKQTHTLKNKLPRCFGKCNYLTEQNSDSTTSSITDLIPRITKLC